MSKGSLLSQGVDGATCLSARSPENPVIEKYSPTDKHSGRKVSRLRIFVKIFELHK